MAVPSPPLQCRDLLHHDFTGSFPEAEAGGRARPRSPRVLASISGTRRPLAFGVVVPLSLDKRYRLDQVESLKKGQGNIGRRERTRDDDYRNHGLSLEHVSISLGAGPQAPGTKADDEVLNRADSPMSSKAQATLANVLTWAGADFFFSLFHRSISFQATAGWLKSWLILGDAGRTE